ncbi:unnamed protein product [Arctogadus glacialis]
MFLSSGRLSVRSQTDVSRPCCALVHGLFGSFLVRKMTASAKDIRPITSELRLIHHPTPPSFPERATSHRMPAL